MAARLVVARRWVLLLAGCGTTWEGRAIGGAAIGAGGEEVAGALTSPS